MSHVTISGFSGDPISGHVISAPISGHIDTNIDTDIGYSPISESESGHSESVTDIVHYIPDIGVNIGTNMIGMPDIGNCNNRCRCQYRIQYRVIPDIGVNIGYNIGCPDIGV